MLKLLDLIIIVPFDLINCPRQIEKAILGKLLYTSNMSSYVIPHSYPLIGTVMYDAG